ncbi:cupin domain-containing protein [Robiginitalea sp. IMCC43444]|uniref:cupin domain-containing protein n=1 Tax=Robiginitalea sp. IMCC43444 TaxID=3459121 RepID=UPI004042C4AB
MKPINIREKLSRFKDHWHPRQIAVVDQMQVLLAKLSGSFVWHQHPDQDELFQVIRGTLYMEFRDRTEMVREGEIIVVPKGIEHRPRTEEGKEVHVLLFEHQQTEHTGGVSHPLTQTHYPKI